MLFTTVTEGACHRTDISVDNKVTIFIAPLKIFKYHVDDDKSDFDKDDDDLIIVIQIMTTQVMILLDLKCAGRT